jgi:hypothetical protein
MINGQASSHQDGAADGGQDSTTIKEDGGQVQDGTATATTNDAQDQDSMSIKEDDGQVQEEIEIEGEDGIWIPL